MIRYAFRLSCLLLLLASGSALAQMDFSADLVDLAKPGTPVLAKMYFTKDKRRVEMQAASGRGSIIMRMTPALSEEKIVDVQIGGEGKVAILDLVTKMTTVLSPQRKTYFENPRTKMSELYSLYAVVQPTNVDDACSEWMKGPGAEGETCRNVGRENVHDRPTVKYELSCYGEVCKLWIDCLSHALVKRETKWNSTELRNIQEVPPPHSLFAVPADYTAEESIGGIIGPREPQ